MVCTLEAAKGIGGPIFTWDTLLGWPNGGGRILEIKDDLVPARGAGGIADDLWGPEAVPGAFGGSGDDLDLCMKGNRYPKRLELREDTTNGVPFSLDVGI